jgi:hypothetical protein
VADYELLFYEMLLLAAQLSTITMACGGKVT